MNKLLSKEKDVADGNPLEILDEIERFPGNDGDVITLSRTDRQSLRTAVEQQAEREAQLVEALEAILTLKPYPKRFEGMMGGTEVWSKPFYGFDEVEEVKQQARALLAELSSNEHANAREAREET